MGKKIKISKAQAKMLKEALSKKKVTITESQLKMIREFQKNATNEIAASDTIGRNFKKEYSNVTRKQIYEDFINDVYNMNENSDTKYSSLINTMEENGFIKENKLVKEKFNSNKELAKKVIETCLTKFNKGIDESIVIEMMKRMVNEDTPGFPSGVDNAPDFDSEDSNSEDECIDVDENFEFNYLDKVGTLFFIAMNKKGDKFVINNEANLGDENLFNNLCVDEAFTENVQLERTFLYINYFKDTILEDEANLIQPFTEEVVAKLSKIYGENAPREVKELNSLFATVNEMDYSGPLSGPIKGKTFKSNVAEDELEETTTTGSVGGADGMGYDAPVGRKKDSDFWNAGNRELKEYEEDDDFPRDENGNRAKFPDELIDNYYEKSNYFRAALEMWKGEKTVGRMRDLKKASEALGIDLPLDYSKIEDESIPDFRHLNDIREDSETDTQYPGGSFVEFDDCTKLNNNTKAQNGGCNFGSDVVKTKKSKKSVVSNDSLYESISKKTGKSVSEVKEIIEKNKNLHK